uniref:Uncharacterized protein n=1 Tax=Prolemur simus TaxID=1328070 RepID=A0A8C9A019_PROSS
QLFDHLILHLCPAAIPVSIYLFIVILNGNLQCHFKSISQIFARHFMEGDTGVKTLSCIPTVR